MFVITKVGQSTRKMGRHVLDILFSLKSTSSTCWHGDDEPTSITANALTHTSTAAISSSSYWSVQATVAATSARPPSWLARPFFHTSVSRCARRRRRRRRRPRTSWEISADFLAAASPLPLRPPPTVPAIVAAHGSVRERSRRRGRRLLTAVWSMTGGSMSFAWVVGFLSRRARFHLRL